MRPGGGTRSNYAHSANMTKFTRNAHISYNFDDEDEDSLFVPELPKSLQEEVRALKRKRERSSSINNQATEEDCKGMFAPLPGQDDLAAVHDKKADSCQDPQQCIKSTSPTDTGDVASTPVPEVKPIKKNTVSNSVAARLAAIRASRTPQPRTPTPGASSVRAASHMRTASISRELGSPSTDTGSPTTSRLEMKRAELARIQAARAAVNDENEAMLQAIEAVKAKKAQAEAKELEELEKEIAAENEKLEIAEGHAEEIRAHGLDVENGLGAMGEGEVKLELEE